MTEETAEPTGIGNSGIVAIVGRTNVGKSTLVNHLLGEKVSIVSDTVQTTRNLIRAILTEPRGQMVFLDTPGVHKAQGEMGKNLNKAARAAVQGVDAILLVLDRSSKPALEDDGWLRRLAREEGPCIIAFNKSDRNFNCSSAYKELWNEIKLEKESAVEPVWTSVSALNGDGMAGLLDILFENIPVGPPLFPDDILTDYPRKLNIADVIREKLFHRLHDELPHAVAVWVEEIVEGEKKWSVEASIYVERHSQKGIVIGEKGRLLKWVREQAEKELYEMYGVRFKLTLWVKVEKNWRKNFWILKKLGYA
ncbi:GTPase Era [Pontiella sulfatireligans]|uniref:GTPase Era n=1 Tax=Pontiella sulfatireligans TaxID=2750658 RepID=A0A6C2UR79_9BACT|nr:GTPase Era [Pontiella sulfatireligans]VGO21794.1 GTPase Era [Pontiella sulfatireligans]